MLKQSKFTDHEINVRKNLASEKRHRQRILKAYFAVQLLEWFFPPNICCLIQN